MAWHGMADPIIKEVQSQNTLTGGLVQLFYAVGGNGLSFAGANIGVALTDHSCGKDSQ